MLWRWKAIYKCLSITIKVQVNELRACDLNGMPVNTQSTDSQTTKEASAKTHNPHDNKPLIWQCFQSWKALRRDHSDLGFPFTGWEKGSHKWPTEGTRRERHEEDTSVPISTSYVTPANSKLSNIGKKTACAVQMLVFVATHLDIGKYTNLRLNSLLLRINVLL